MAYRALSFVMPGGGNIGRGRFRLALTSFPVGRVKAGRPAAAPAAVAEPVGSGRPAPAAPEVLNLTDASLWGEDGQ